MCLRLSCPLPVIGQLELMWASSANHRSRQLRRRQLVYISRHIAQTTNVVIRGLQSELYLPFGPKDIPRRIPCLGIEMKYIGHIATHRVSTPNMPTKDDSKLTFSLTLLWYFSFFYLQSQHILTVEFCTSWHIFPQTHFSVHEKTATNDELYLADAVIFITLPEKWWQMQLQW